MMALVRGLRGFAKEFSRTGSMRALWLQVRTGTAHVARTLAGRRDGDPIALFLTNYGADGVRLPDAELAATQLSAQRCLACGLCSLECARVGGAPVHDPLEAVAAAARQTIDILRLGPALGATPPHDAARACAGCAACETVCPVGIPIARVQAVLARLEAEAAQTGLVPMATVPAMR
jgi:Fe-S oxidoreductase